MFSLSLVAPEQVALQNSIGDDNDIKSKNIVLVVIILTILNASPLGCSIFVSFLNSHALSQLTIH